MAFCFWTSYSLIPWAECLLAVLRVTAGLVWSERNSVYTFEIILLCESKCSQGGQLGVRLHTSVQVWAHVLT